MFSQIISRTFAFSFALAALALEAKLDAAPVVTVNPSQSLQAALDSVPDGGIVELAAGTYTAPPTALTIFPDLSGNTKSFTIRAATGATVIITGGGARGLFTLTTPKLVTFQNINFIGGTATDDSFGSVISMQNAQTNFVSCTFQNNVSTAPVSGGGVRVDTSKASFQSCSFTNNTATTFGAAIIADKARVYIRDCQFLGNRIDVANHVQFSAGGAIHANGSTLQVSTSRFDNNRAAYVGAAIYAYGPWTDPTSVPTMNVTISNCVFTGNAVAKLPTDTFAAPATGGAVMLEDQTVANIYNSRFLNNSARQGGAISSYRTQTRIQNCVFDGNTATGTAGGEGYGGAIIALSDDNADASTVGGTINRPSAQLTVTDSLIHGGGAGAPAAGQGGGIFAAGDMHANFGVGVTKNGTPDTNRATVVLQRVAFVDLYALNGQPGSGGAMSGAFINLTANNSLVINCGSDNQGGGLRFVNLSTVALNNCTLANTSTGILGGGLAMAGGDLHVSGCNFLQNSLTGAGGGKAVWVAPAPSDGTIPSSDITGSFDNCVFNSTTAGAVLIYDGGNPLNPPYNRMQYNNLKLSNGEANVLFTDTIGYKTATELNNYSVTLLDGSKATKSTGGNVSGSSAFVTASLLMVPAQTFVFGAPGETLPTTAYLPFAVSGATAVLDGAAQGSPTGLATTASNQSHTLAAGSANASTRPVPAAALNISTRLPAGSGDNVLIGGFIVVGSDSKRVLVRAVGPSLGVTNSLANPTLELHDASGKTVASNDDWQNGNQTVDVIATSVPPSNQLESAILTTLAPGNYTAVLAGANGGTGIALVEVYDLDAVQNSTLANISTRGFVQGGDNAMIGGFIYGGGQGPTNVVIRALGPSLTKSGVTNPLLDPTLELHNGNGDLIDSNDDFSTAPQGFAPTDPRESLIYRQNLTPGAYTAIVKGKSNATGVGLVEVYIY